MKIRDIPIKSRFPLLAVFSVLFWLLAGFLIHSLVSTQQRINQTSQNLQSIVAEISKLEILISNFYLYDNPSDLFQETGRSETMDEFNRIYPSAYSGLRSFRDDPFLNKKPLLLQKLDNVTEYLYTTSAVQREIVMKSRQRGRGKFGLAGLVAKGMDNLVMDIPTSDKDQTGVLKNQLVTEIINYLSNPENIRRTTIEGILAELAGSNQEAENLAVALRNLFVLDRQLGTTRYEGLKAQVYHNLDILNEEMASLQTIVDLEIRKRRTNINLAFILIVLISSLVFGFASFALNRTISMPLEKLRSFVNQLARGIFPEDIDIRDNNEITEISSTLNRFAGSLKEKSEFASSLTDGNESVVLALLSKEDQLGNALIKVSEHIQAAKAEDMKHQLENEKRRWANEGIARFGEILRIHSDSIESLAENITSQLVKYLDASIGGMFLVKNKEGNTILELVSSFALDRKKYMRREIPLGEGLVGTCAIEKQRIFITEIPEDYIQISSGLGESKPRSLLLVPLKLEDKILGVIEIASVNIFENHQLDFIEELAESIASSLGTVKMNMTTAQLLEKSQKQAREMAKQEEIMRENMEKLQTTQEESAIRESEISGILNAVHHSSLVAEYNMDEELISINDKFIYLMETSREQIIGKKYSEILGVTRHSDSYKKFWEELKSGETISKVEKFKLLTGNELWLRQTFTPILDKQGTAFKVLNIASDMTESIKQQESLKKQAAEIARANSVMKSFSDAVDQAILKCVYSPAGQIIEVNENFENVTGYNAKEMLGKNNRVFLQRTEREQFEKIWSDIVKEKPYSGVIRRTRPTGEEVWIMSSFTPAKDENGNIFKVFFLGQDITERKLKYQLLEEANKEIERLRKDPGA